MIKKIKSELRSISTPQKAKASAWFFKTGQGEYGEGDIFIGCTVPEQRAVAKRYRDLAISDIIKLLHSKEHEYRLTALLIMVSQFNSGNDAAKKELYGLYLKNTKWINNWDLVDLSAPYIVGGYLLKEPRGILKKLAKSKLLWERRIAIIATFAFIRNHEASDTLAIAKLLLKDEHDLIHKAVGWMLREVGKRCGERELTGFLDKFYRAMPRTMLRYAIERLAKEQRAWYMKK